MRSQIITGSVLWTPGADHVLELAAGDAPILEFPALIPVDLTESHGITITPQRLQEMAAAYDPAIEMASLNLDHNWGGPSLGWCERVWLQDSALWVRYIDLDPATVELIRSKRYTRRSAEIALSHPVTGGWYLTGCALLGNARPAIPGLPPVTLCRPQYVLTARKETPMPEDDPPATPSPDNPPSGEVELAALRAQVAEGAQALSSLLRQRAELDVDRRLALLGARVTPAMAKLARPLLIELLADRNPATVKLQADPAKPAVDVRFVEVSIADQVLHILAAVPAVEALTAGRMADADPAATPTRRSLFRARSRARAEIPLQRELGLPVQLKGEGSMAALTADVHRMHSVHQPQFLPLPVKAGARIYLNAITCTDPNGFAVPGGHRRPPRPWRRLEVVRQHHRRRRHPRRHLQRLRRRPLRRSQQPGRVGVRLHRRRAEARRRRLHRGRQHRLHRHLGIHPPRKVHSPGLAREVVRRHRSPLRRETPCSATSNRSRSRRRPSPSTSTTRPIPRPSCPSWPSWSPTPHSPRRSTSNGPRSSPSCASGSATASPSRASPAGSRSVRSCTRSPSTSIPSTSSAARPSSKPPRRPRASAAPSRSARSSWPTASCARTS